MMYHFDVSIGESPDLATVKEAPLESYFMFPWAVKLSEALVRSIFTALPRAELGGQFPMG